MSDRYARQSILPEVGAEGQARLGAAVVVEVAGKIYVMDSGNSRLVRIDDMNGTNWTGATTGRGSGVGQFAQYSTAVAFDTFGSIYVADTGNHVIRMIDTDETITTIAWRNRTCTASRCIA